jgi:hypothetical protein
MSNNIDTGGGVYINGDVKAARDFIGRNQFNIAVHLHDVNGAAQVTRTLAMMQLTQGDLESESIRADLLSLMEELRRTHSTIIKSISPLRRIPDNEATFAGDFRAAYNNFRDFYDAYDFWEERTHCHKIGRIQGRLEQHNAAIMRSNEWAHLRQNLVALSHADLDVIEQHYKPFMQHFNNVMVEIDRLVMSGEVVQAITLKQVFLNELSSQYDGIKEMLRLMTATIAEIETSLP